MAQVNVKYQVQEKNGEWSSTTISTYIKMDSPSESLIKNYILNKRKDIKDARIIDFKVM